MAQIQKNGGTADGTTSIVTSLGSATTAGNTILVFISSAGAISTPAGFTSRSPQVGLQGCYLFEKLVASGNATDTPTLTQGGAYNATWLIAEYSGITSFKTSNGANSGNSPDGSYSTGSVTPAAGDTLLVGYVSVTGSTATATFNAADPQSWTNSFVGEQSILRTGTAGPGRDSLASGWATLQVTANGSTAYSTAASFDSSSLGAPHRIIAAYAVTVAAGTAYTLAAVVGALALTGIAAGLVYAPAAIDHLTLTAARGSFALTGRAATLRVTRVGAATGTSTRAAQLVAQYETKIGKVGQWVAIRRTTGTTVKTWTDTPAKAYLQYKPAKEFIGAVVQNYLVAIALVDTLGGILPMSTNDKLVTEFYGHDDLGGTPTLDGESHVTGGKQFAINSAIKRTPGGQLIAIEIHAVG